MTSSDITVKPGSLHTAAGTLHDLAHDLSGGEFDLFALAEAAAPNSHPAVAAAIRDFGEFAHDQYRDAIALLVALSTRVAKSGTAYAKADAAVATEIGDLITTANYHSPASATGK